MCGTMMEAPDAPLALQPKYKRKNSEQRKEKSRDAARDRRAKESQLFQDLEDLLPMSGVPGSLQNAMDKTSLIRLTLANLKCRDVIEKGLEFPTKIEKSQEVMSRVEMLECIDAFCLVLSQEIDVIYVSNNVANHIGLTWLELMGQSFYDYVHPCDHHQLKAVVNLEGGNSKEAYIRIKVTVTDRGRMINLRQANYKVLKMWGLVRSFESGRKDGFNEKAFLGLGHLIGTDTMALNADNFALSGVFQTKHSSDMRFVETDQWLSSVGKYPSHHLQGMSFYQFIHAGDCQKLQKSLKNLCEQGQCETPPYRFLIAGGGWVWIQTRANQSSARKGTLKGHTISCTHTAISEVINKGDIVALVQIATDGAETKSARRKQNIENVAMKEIEPIENIYDGLQMLNEQASIVSKVEENFSSQKTPNYIDLLDLWSNPSTPSVIVTPKKPEPKVTTETIFKRSSVIVATKSMATRAAPEQMTPNVFKKTEESAFQEPRAITTVLFSNADEPEADCTASEQIIIDDVNQDIPEKTDIQIDDEALFSLSNAVLILDEIIPLESEKLNTALSPSIGSGSYFVNKQGQELEEIAPFYCDLIKIEDKQPETFMKKDVPLFDFFDETAGKQQKQKVNENENHEDNSEDVFKILEEATQLKEDNPDEGSKTEDARNSLLREDKKIMWGLNNGDPELENYLVQFSNKFNKTPVVPTSFDTNHDAFYYDPHQGKNNIINEVWKTVVDNPPTNKPTNLTKMWPNQEQMWKRKGSPENQDQTSVLRTVGRASIMDKPQFPELRKILESEALITPTKGPTSYDDIFNMNPMENPKRIRMDC